MKRIALFTCDLLAIGLAAVSALVVRDNFDISLDELINFAPYATASVLIGATGLFVFGLHRGVWALTTLSDYLRLCALSVLIVALSMSVSFLGNRLQNIARALPVIQILLTIVGLVGLRVAARLVYAWCHDALAQDVTRPDFAMGARTVILVGLNRLTLLYVRSIEDLAASKVRVAGIVADHASNHGRSLGSYPVLGRPIDLSRIVADLAVHGVFVTHICIMMSRRDLSDASFAELSAVAEEHALEIEFFLDKLTGSSAEAPRPQPLRNERALWAPQARVNEQFWQYAHRPYWKIKRAFDIVGSAALILLAAPIFVLVGLIVALDVGLPVLFWQQRPGARGRAFRIYKFRTMREAFDRYGHRLADEDRVSVVGHALREFRLDELPQLFNVLIGDMSFVGPRPLLPIDQFPGLDARLAIAPGITGWAQVNGGRAVPAADKAALDLWYLQNASLRVDVSILLATVRTLIKGEATNQQAIDLAWTELRARRPVEVGMRADEASSRLMASSHRVRALK